MPIELLNRLPKSLRELLQNGTYTLYKSKDGGGFYFVETKPRFGYVVDVNGKIIEETSLDECRFQQIIHYVLPEARKTA